jgi:hypothetical protein
MKLLLFLLVQHIAFNFFMTTTYTHPLLGLQFDHPKNLKVIIIDNMKQGVVQIHFVEKASLTTQLPFTIEYLVNSGTTLDQCTNVIVNNIKRMVSTIPSVVPPSLNTNFMNSTKHKQSYNTKVFELEMLPMKLKQWNYLIEGPSCFIHGFFKHTPNSVEEFTMFQKMMESLEFFQAMNYGSLFVNEPVSGLTIPMSFYLSIVSDPTNDPNMIFDAKGGLEGMFCYTFTNFKSLEDFVESRMNRWSQIEKFNIEKLHVDVEATILEFTDPNSGYNFTEMCFENKGIYYLINASKTTDSPENFMSQLMGTTFLPPKKNKKKCLIYKNYFLLAFEMELPMDGNVMEEIGSEGIVSYVDSQNLTITKVTVMDNHSFSNHHHLLNTLLSDTIQMGGKIISYDIRNINDKEYGLYTMVSIHFHHINGLTGITSGLLYNQQCLVVDSFIDPQHVPRFFGTMKDIHQSIKPKKMGCHDFNFKSNLLNDQMFGDIVFTGISNDFETFCFHVGVKFVHSSDWDIQVNQFYPPPSVQYTILKKNQKNFGNLTVDTLPSKQGLDSVVDTFIHGKEVLERSKFTIHKLEAESVLINTKYGKEWNALCVKDHFIYVFSYSEETHLKDFIKVVKKCKFIEPMNNGRSMYHNAEFELSFLLPSFDFTPNIINTRDTLVHASAKGLNDFSVTLMKNEAKDLNSLIDLRKNVNSQSHRTFKDRKPVREDVLDGHIFEMNTSGDVKDVSILEYSFMRNGVGLSLIYRGWTEQFEMESPELYLLEMKFDPKFKKDTICYECILYNFSICVPPKSVITEFLHADSQLHKSEVVSFILPDESLTYITKEPHPFRGLEHFYEETKMRILSTGTSILSIRLDKRKNCNVFVTVVFESKKTGFIGIMSKFIFSEGSTLTMDTTLEKSKFKDSYLQEWIEMHESLSTIIQPSFFDHGVLDYSLKIDLPTEFVDTEFIFQ